MKYDSYISAAKQHRIFVFVSTSFYQMWDMSYPRTPTQEKEMRETVPYRSWTALWNFGDRNSDLFRNFYKSG